MVKVDNCIWVRRQKIHTPGYEGFRRHGLLAIRHSTDISNSRRLTEAAPNRFWIFVVDTPKVPSNDTLHVLLLLRVHSQARS
jgi:hypothetical protein